MALVTPAVRTSIFSPIFMSDTTANTANNTVNKVNVDRSCEGDMNQKYLASGEQMSMRLWENEQPSEVKPEVQRDYETLGYAIAGRAELHIEGRVVRLEPGDSWVVPCGASHTYNILEPFTAVEATSPPARDAGRDRLGE